MPPDGPTCFRGPRSLPACPSGRDCTTESGLRQRSLQRRGCELQHHHGSCEQRSASSRRARCRVRSTTREEEAASAEQAVGGLDAASFPFQLPKAPRFQPFIGEVQSETRNQLQAFRQTAQLDEGELSIAALAEEDIPAATELLATSFAEAVGYMPMYRGLLKQEVRQYLHSHLNIAPKAIILVAVLRRPDDEYRTLESAGEHGTATLASGEAPDGDTLGASASSEERRLADAASPPSNPLQPQGPLESALGSVLAGAEGAAQQLGQASGGAAGPAPPNPQPGREAADEAVQAETAAEVAQEAASTASAEESGASADAEGSSMDTYSSFSDEKAEALRGADREDASRSGLRLVGTVELSFSSSTRTPAVTLNPPRDSAYLCNMAVAEAFQRQGHGMRILAAAEQVVKLAGFKRVYLHVRLKDGPAKGLYHKAGFEVEKEDCMLVSLWDHRRQLLSKFLPSREAPAASTAAPEDTFPVETEY